MPIHIVSYIRGLVQGHKITATALYRQFGFSHDAITRLLVARFAWKRWLIHCIQQVFGVIRGGYLLIDDTVLAKPYGKTFGGASYVYSSIDKKAVFGYRIVMIVWTNGRMSLPLAWRWYKANRYTRVELALLLLEEIRWKWKITDCTVIYDSWYAAAKVMRLVKRLGYAFVSQIKSNRTVDGQPLSSKRLRKDTIQGGLLAGEVPVYYFKHVDKYYVTSIPQTDAVSIHALYKMRWRIEEIFRFFKSVLHLSECQARRITAQKIHLVSCVIAYLMIQKEQEVTTRSSLYAIQESWQLHKHRGRCRINHYVTLFQLPFT